MDIRGNRWRCISVKGVLNCNEYDVPVIVVWEDWSPWFGQSPWLTLLDCKVLGLVLRNLWDYSPLDRQITKSWDFKLRRTQRIDYETSVEQRMMSSFQEKIRHRSVFDKEESVSPFIFSRWVLLCLKKVNLCRRDTPLGECFVLKV